MTAFNNIKKYATIRGYSLQEVAEKAGLSKNMIYQYKKVNPKLETLKKIANVLNVSTNDLIEYKSNHGQEQTVDINDDDVIFTYEGRKIPKEDIELMRRLLRGSKK